MSHSQFTLEDYLFSVHLVETVSYSSYFGCKEQSML